MILNWKYWWWNYLFCFCFSMYDELIKIESQSVCELESKNIFEAFRQRWTGKVWKDLATLCLAHIHWILCIDFREGIACLVTSNGSDLKSVEEFEELFSWTKTLLFSVAPRPKKSTKAIVSSWLCWRIGYQGCFWYALLLRWREDSNSWYHSIAFVVRCVLIKLNIHNDLGILIINLQSCCPESFCSCLSLPVVHICIMCDLNFDPPS